MCPPESSLNVASSLEGMRCGSPCQHSVLQSAYSPLRKVVKAALLGASTVAMKPGWASWKPRGVA